MGSRPQNTGKLYVGRVVLENGVAVWGSASKSNFDKVNKVQN